MKMINRINLVMIVILMLFARISSAEVVGGYVNSDQKEYIVVFFDAIATQKILLGASLDAIKINDGAENRSGKLYVVQPSGKWAISAKAYKDRAGLVVSVPTDKLDKVIYLGYDMKVRGAMGLSESEIAKVATLKKSVSLARAAEMIRPERQKALFEGVEHAAQGALDGYRMDDDERAEIFNSTVGWTAGRVAQDMVEGILKAADNDEDLPANLIKGREFISADEAVIRGIGLVADDDNGGGGKGYVNDDDNGGGGKGYVNDDDNGGGGKGLVADDDNGGGGKGLINDDDNGGGGKGLVADDDNGGGGKGLVNDDDNGGGGKGFVSVVVSGWDVDMKSVDLPNAKGLNANCAGTYLYLF